MAFLDENGMTELWSLVKAEDAKIGSGFKKIASARLSEPTNHFYMELDKPVSNYGFLVVKIANAKQTGAAWSQVYVRVYLVDSLTSTKIDGGSIAESCLLKSGEYDLGSISILGVVKNDDGTVHGAAICGEPGGNTATQAFRISTKDTKFLYIKHDGSTGDGRDHLPVGFTVEVWGCEV